MWELSKLLLGGRDHIRPVKFFFSPSLLVLVIVTSLLSCRYETSQLKNKNGLFLKIKGAFPPLFLVVCLSFTSEGAKTAHDFLHICSTPEKADVESTPASVCFISLTYAVISSNRLYFMRHLYRTFIKPQLYPLCLQAAAPTIITPPQYTRRSAYDCKQTQRQ